MRSWDRAMVVEKAAEYAGISPRVTDRLAALLPDEALLGDAKITEAGALGVGAAARLYVAATKKERERLRLVYEIASGRAGKPDTWLALRTGRRVWEIVPAPLRLDVAQSRNTVVFDPLRFLEFLCQS